MKTPFLPLLALACAIASTAVAADDLQAATKKIFDQRKDSVVWVSVVAKVTISASDAKSPLNIPDQEKKLEAVGTIVDPAGLVVCALSSVDPAKEISGREINTASGRVKLEASATMKEVKIVMADGTEIPADVVMKDADLDLAFIRTKADAKEAKGVTYPALDLKDSVSAQVADEVVTVSRADELLNRQPMVQRGQIVCAITKPRAFLRALGSMTGSPTFALNGKLIGIGVTRSTKEKNPILVVLPAADVLEIAEQAKAAKALPAESAKPATEKSADAK